MNKKSKVFISTVVIFVLLLVGAQIYDSKSTQENKRQELEALDLKIRDLEERAILQIDSMKMNEALLSRVRQQKKLYEKARTPQERKTAFENLISFVEREIISNLDQSLPLNRKIVDEFLGVLNRRKVVENASP